MINILDLAAGIDTMSPAMQAVWQSAESMASDSGDAIYLPPGSYLLSATLRVNKLIGAPGQSIIHLAENFIFGGSESFFAIENYGYTSVGAIPKVECVIDYYGISIESQHAYPQLCAIMGIAGATSGRVDRCSFVARLSDPQKPPQIDSLLSFVAACKNIKVSRSYFSNRTGWHGATVNEHRGGIDIGIRNGIQTNRDLDQNATEFIEVTDCDFLHCTSDESIAIWGGQGHTRKNKVYGNRFVSDRISGTALGEPLHDVLLSIYPGDVGGGLGDSAQVYENEVYSNCIIDKAGSRYCIRVGYGISTDLDNNCYSNKVYNNSINITVPDGFGVGAAIGQNKDTYPAGLENSNNKAFGNIIQINGNENKPSGVYNFDGIYENVSTGNLVAQTLNCTFAKVCDAVLSSVGGVISVAPSGHDLGEIFRKYSGVYIKKDGNGTLSYYAGNDK